ncbi:MAG: hypothetical protein SVX38_11705 [Chloroflexota bacterium]|nr:hypothetical protein [Chloroflexota bacterium]
MSREVLAVVALCAAMLLSCSMATPVPTKTPSPTDTPLPTATPTELPERTPPSGTQSDTMATPVPTKTPSPTDTPLPTATPTELPELTPPSGTQSDTMATPVPSWEDMPIMPGAIEGRPAGWSYVYSVGASTDEVETYYLEQMAERGWRLSKRQFSEVGLFGGPAIVLDFSCNGERANVMMAFSVSDDYTVVMLTYFEAENST